MDFNKIVKRIKNCYQDYYDTAEEYEKALDDIHSDLYRHYGGFADDIIEVVQDITGGSYGTYSEYELLSFNEFVERYILDDKSSDAVELWDMFMGYMDIDDRYNFVMTNYVDDESNWFQVNKGQYVIVCN